MNELQERSLHTQAKYKRSEKGRLTQARYYRSQAKREESRRYRENNREKIKAYKIVERAVQNGELIRLPCVICGDERSQGHHEDYSEPLKVIWLCNFHHWQHHNRKRGDSMSDRDTKPDQPEPSPTPPPGK